MIKVEAGEKAGVWCESERIGDRPPSGNGE